MDGSNHEFEFTNQWFIEAAIANWESLVPQIKPRKMLEIGSFEGASACYMIGKNTWHDDADLYCIDTWEGSIDHQADGVDMGAVEARFDHNVMVAQELAKKKCSVTKIKGTSDTILPQLLNDGHAGSFDFVYIDGSHQAPDVLLDAVLAFKLCRVGGLMVFDDYLWSENLPDGVDPIRCPKIAIDAFTNIYARKLQLVSAPLYQLYAVKQSD